MANPTHWGSWLPIAMAVHNNRTNAMIWCSPNQALIGFNPRLHPTGTRPTTNEEANQRLEAVEQFRKVAIEAINQKANNIPPDQYKPRDKVWLEVTHLKLPYQMIKLASKRYGPFVISKKISPVAYQLTLPHAWKIHNVFHTSLLSPYHEMTLYSPNYTRPPLDLINNKEQYKVKSIQAHWCHGRSRSLQYLIK